MKFKLYTLLLFAAYSCKTKNDACFTGKDSTLFLHPVNCSFQLPGYIVKDTFKFGDYSNELNYSILSKDSLVDIVCLVTNYEKDMSAMPEFMIFKEFQKKELKNNRAEMKLLKDTVRHVNGVDIGYVQYSGGDKWGLQSHVFFYVGSRVVVLWIFDERKYESGKVSTVSDCIVNSFRLGHF